MAPDSQHPLLSWLHGFASCAALGGALLCLGWLANRLESMPERRLDPWNGASEDMPLVIVDAGHGGHDGGAVANNLVEKNLALELGMRLRQHLQDQGMRVKMTRETDVFIPLDKRS